MSTGIGGDLEHALQRYATRPQILLATDFDGVLAPLVHDPSTSRPVDGSIAALRALARRDGVTVAVVSGRDLASLHTLTGISPEEDIVLIGSHGAETREDLALATGMDDAAHARLAAATTAVQAIVAAHPPTRIEHKPAGVVLHTRGVPEPVAAQATAEALALDLPGVDVMAGKQVVELSVLPVTKGSALLALAASRGTGATCYLGDDVTDERAFAVLTGADDVTIRVGPGETLAAHRIQGPQNVLEVLQDVLAAR